MRCYSWPGRHNIVCVRLLIYFQPVDYSCRAFVDTKLSFTLVDVESELLSHTCTLLLTRAQPRLF